MTTLIVALAVVLPAAGLPRRSGAAAEAGPSHVDITWMSVTKSGVQLIVPAQYKED